jgi:hypothetical protein
MDDVQVTLAQLALGALRSWDVPPRAERWLTDGVYSDSIVELAEIADPTWDVIEPLLSRVAAELGLTAPTRESAARLLIRSYCEQVAEGAGEPELHLGGMCRDLEGSGILHESTCETLGDRLGVADLVGIYYSYDDVSSLPAADQDRLRAELDRAAVAAANAYLARSGTA